MSNSTSTPILASFATLKSLNDSKKYINSYQILAEFIKYIIDGQKLYVFTAIEMKNRLKSVFGFDIPEAVVKTASKSLPFVTRENGTYIVDIRNFVSDHAFERAKAIAEEANTGAISLLKEYISKREPEKEIDEDLLTQDLIAFLVDDQKKSSGQYTDLISEFVLKNENNNNVQRTLETIREGSILYIGLNYNINETGNLTKKLTLFLGTEVLFSLAGFNGEVYKQLAEDLFAQIKSANLNGTKIFLRYFSDVRKEMDSFFNGAKMIIEKNMVSFDTVAMKAILNSCEAPSDVDVKKADFYYKLQYHYGIIEDEKDDYYSKENDVYNLESMEYTDEQVCESWKYISHINKLRKGSVFTNNFDAEYLIVTNTKCTLNISREQTERAKKENGLDYANDYAVSVDRMTNILWYKLGNGFGTKNYPCNVNIVLKARTVLSATISHNIATVYNDAKEKNKNGEITSDQLAARIITLRRKPVLPEDLEGDSIDEIMDFSPEFLSRYEEEVSANKIALEEKDKEIQKRDQTIEHKDQVIQRQQEEKTNLESELALYRAEKDKRARRKKRAKQILRFVWSILWKIVIIAAITYIAIFFKKKLNSSIPLYICAAVDLFGLVLTAQVAIKKDIHKYLSKEDTAK